MPGPIITLLTDFGTHDAYVGALKGVLLSICPGARIADLSHEVPPQDVQHAAWLLRTAAPYFPEGAIHVAVVDPGVGGERRAIAACARGQCFVAPDNGVLSWAVERDDAQFVELTERAFHLPNVTATFHGRDIFAPVAAHLASGVAIESLGRSIHDPVWTPMPRPEVHDGELHGEVIHVDRFGNLITNIDRGAYDPWCSGRHAVAMQIADTSIDGISSTYATAAPGELLALFGSAGHLEVAARDGNAGAQLGVARGAPIILR